MNKKEALEELERQINCFENGLSFEYTIEPLKVAVEALKKEVVANAFGGNSKDIKIKVTSADIIVHGTVDKPIL